ncbi:ABC transporter ATP-binding protein [Subtercola endophyticus]|uniref:ABC transporter ATP-binding protein n=1 Tax=Subtercola endophyticus TaxID=2895559 RepID=UPI001E310BC2|nr:ABC transporter ATP-binding protein [Subtercola endophyticus]UFS59307.1 ABC transporter ATP-binding protein [Subtercola endophyticus]
MAHTTLSAPRVDTDTKSEAVALRGLTKSFGRVQAVKNVDLTVKPGEIVAFLGPNGAGKTSTVDMILGLSKPDAGEVTIYGMAPHIAIARGQVAAVMQTGGLLRDLTVRETIVLTATLFPGARPVDEVLDRAGILDIGDRRVGKCSGGQQQRLRFALALLPDPDLLILDEPTTGMDVEGRRDFWNAIRADAATGRTVIFATHYLEEADAYADRIVLIREGEIVADGTAAEIKNLASGRTVRATVSNLDRSALRALPGVDDIEDRGDGVLIHASDSDAVARYLLTETDARDLEITSHNLEDAFLTLTSSRASNPPGGGRNNPADRTDSNGSTS